jgi:hypothetical protein
MNIGYLKVERRIAPRRASVLRKLGISNLVSTAMFDIEAAHEALVRRQAVPERIFADGLVVRPAFTIRCRIRAPNFSFAISRR